jgi:hypothetical protein
MNMQEFLDRSAEERQDIWNKAIEACAKYIEEFGDGQTAETYARELRKDLKKG